MNFDSLKLAYFVLTGDPQGIILLLTSNNLFSITHPTSFFQSHIQQHPVFSHTSNNILFSITHPTSFFQSHIQQHPVFKSECEKHCQTAADTSVAQRPFPTWDFSVCVDWLVAGVASESTNVNLFPLQLHLSVTAAARSHFYTAFRLLKHRKIESMTWNAFRQAR